MVYKTHMPTQTPPAGESLYLLGYFWFIYKQGNWGSWPQAQKVKMIRTSKVHLDNTLISDMLNVS